MADKQRTISNDISISGIGLHTGCKVNLSFKPAEENAGINFIRVDLPNKPVIKADPSNLLSGTDRGLPRCTTIGSDGGVVHTVEHLMSVLCGLKINNLVVEIDDVELPGLDGSGIDFIRVIRKAGIVEQEAESKIFNIMEPLGVENNGSSIYIVPSKQFTVSYTLDYNHPYLRSQFVSAVVKEETFEEILAPCRTFCLEEEAKELRDKGLGKGANYENTLVVGREGVIDNKERFPDEFARHKILDFIGDVYLLGVPLRGDVFAVKSGHHLNLELLMKIYRQREKFQREVIPPSFRVEGGREIDIHGIMSILPHRYPFLLVDRVIELEEGKRAIGIKNVTINDYFFQGHFPTKPIMPGVLMIEAMAQTAGVTVLTNEAHRGKVAFFLSANNVKFRKVVKPGDQLVMEVEVLKDRPRMAHIQAKAKVGEDVVAEADMVFSFTDASFLD